MDGGRYHWLCRRSHNQSQMQNILLLNLQLVRLGYSKDGPRSPCFGGLGASVYLKPR